MTEYKLTQALMAKALKARTGAEPAETVEMIATLLEIGLAMNIITAQRLGSHERDAHMYDLRAGGLAAPVIATRMGVTVMTVHRGVKSQLLARRAS